MAALEVLGVAATAVVTQAVAVTGAVTQAVAATEAEASAVVREGAAQTEDAMAQFHCNSISASTYCCESWRCTT